MVSEPGTVRSVRHQDPGPVTRRLPGTDVTVLSHFTTASVAPALLSATGSWAVESPRALLWTVVPTAAGLTWTTKVKVADPAGPRRAGPHVMVPTAPDAGVVHDQPVGWASDTNAVPAGRVSTSLASAAVDGPMFDIVTV